MGDVDTHQTDSPSEEVQGLPTGFGPSGRAGDPPVQRVRLTFTKGRALRFIGHLDLVRMWERAFRRSRLPLAYTLGYTPHPRLAFAAPLALGATGGAELVDVYLRTRLPLDELVTKIGFQLPPGCEIQHTEEVDLLGPQLMALTRWAHYRIEATAAPETGASSAVGNEERAQGSRWAPAVREEGADTRADAPPPDQIPWRPENQRVAHAPPAPALPSASEIQRRIEQLLASTELRRQRQREGKVVEYDLRPLIGDIWLEPTGGSKDGIGIETAALGMVLKADSTGSGRPEEVAAALGLRARLIHRVRIGLEGNVPERSDTETA